MLGMLVTLPTILLGITKAIAHLKTIFVDLFGIAYMTSCVLVILIISLTDWFDLAPLALQQRAQLDVSFFLSLLI